MSKMSSVDQMKEALAVLPPKLRAQEEVYYKLHDEYYAAQGAYHDALETKDVETIVRTKAVFDMKRASFLANREQAMPTEAWQHVASFCDHQTRAALSQVDRHMFEQVIYGKHSGVFVWKDKQLNEMKLCSGDGAHVWCRHYISFPHGDGKTPLIRACDTNAKRAVRVLLNAKANIEKIHSEIGSFSDDVLSILLEAGLNASYCIRYVKTPSALRLLLSAGADPFWALVVFTEEHNYVLMKILLKETDVDVNATSSVYDPGYNGNTAMHNIGWGDGDGVGVCKLLVEAGANVNTRNNDGETPMFKCHQSEIAHYLLDVGADPNIRNNNGHTALSELVRDRATSSDILLRLLKVMERPLVDEIDIMTVRNGYVRRKLVRMRP